VKFIGDREKSVIRRARGRWKLMGRAPKDRLNLFGGVPDRRG
jgi:hypothetical protein